MRNKLFIFLLLITATIRAQSPSVAENLFNNRQYEKAKQAYGALLKSKPNDALYNYRYARSCYELNENEKAIFHFEKSGTRYPLRFLYLGELYFKSYRFEESVEAYQSFIATLKENDDRIAGLEEKIQTSELAARLLRRVEDIAIIDSMSVDKEKFLYYYNFNKDLGAISSEKINTGKTNADKITYTTQRGDRICFSDINDGKFDIFSSFKLLDTWTEPVSLSENINSQANENYPFLMLDGVTLYFASDGENSMGGYDLFITKYSPSIQDFLTPENIGMPFNSPYNDYMMVVDELNNVGWFASDRYQPEGKVMIYEFVPNNEKLLFRSDDSDSVRKVAQLKIFRRGERLIKATLSENGAIEKGIENINFIVNDSTIYSSGDEFQSETAKKFWTEWSELHEELRLKKLQLKALRSDFATIEDFDTQSRIRNEIVLMEKKIMDLERMEKTLLIDIRNEENKFIRNNQHF